MCDCVADLPLSNQQQSSFTLHWLVHNKPVKLPGILQQAILPSLQARLNLTACCSHAWFVAPLCMQTSPQYDVHTACMQVHGHDLSCLAYIPNSSCYVSGAEEKVLRVFQAPQAFTESLAMAHGEAPHPAPHPPHSTSHASQVVSLTCHTISARVILIFGW